MIGAAVVVVGGQPGEHPLTGLVDEVEHFVVDAQLTGVGVHHDLRSPSLATDVVGLPPARELRLLQQLGDDGLHAFVGPPARLGLAEDGRLLVGATVEDVGFDEGVTPDAIEQLLACAQILLPAARDARCEGARAGLRPATPDELPIVGASAALPGVYYATGHYRNGVLLAPLTAAMIADLVLDGRERDEAAIVRQALGHLPADQVKVIELAYFGGFTHVEIAEMLDSPVGTVKGRMRLGLKKMREALAHGAVGT